MSAPTSSVRLHGDVELYASGYGDAALDEWVARIRAWLRGSQVRAGSTLASARTPRPRKSRDVYGYFDNDAKMKPPGDAMALRMRMPP